MADLVDLYAARDDDDEEDGDYSSGEERPSPSKKRRRGQDGGHNSDGDEDGDEEDGDEEDSSEEEDDDNEEEARKVAEGFIVEDEEEEGDDEQVRPRKKKRRLQRSRRRSESPVLDEDDLDLLDENLGNRSRRRSPTSQKYKRVRRGGRTPSPTRPRGVEEIFSDEEREEDVETGPPRGEFDDFIEDDEPESEEDDLLKEARRIQREQMKKQRTTYLPNEAGIDADAMEEITQLFGDGLDYEFAMEASDEEEPEYTEEGEERVKDVQLKDIFEPSELKERLLTDADELIRITDEPERFQLYRPAQTPPVDIDVEKESKWISDRLLARDYKRRVEPELEESFRNAVTHVLGFFNTDSLEVPFIWQHRRDFLVHPEREVDESTGTVVLKALRMLLDQDDLWKIWEDDGRYRAIQQRLASLRSVWEGLDLVDRSVEDAMDEVTSIEDVQDLHDYIYFTYSEQLRDQQLLLQNGTNGHAAGYKRAAGNKMAIWEKIRKGDIYLLVRAFGLSARDFGTNVKEGTKRYWTEDPEVDPEAMANDYPDYGSANMAINAAKQMLTEEIFHNPNVRKFFRDLLLGSPSRPSRAGYSVKPTERGLKKIDDAHPYYHFKYLTNQRISSIPLKPDRFLQIMAAETDGLVTMDINIPNIQERIRELVELIISDNFSEVALAWNKLREEVLTEALGKLIPFTMKLVKESLRVECEEILGVICRQKFLQRLDQAPWHSVLEMDKGQLPSVLAISCGYGDAARDAVVCAYVDDLGRLVEQITLPDVRELDNKRELADFIERRGPDVIGLAGFSIQTYRLHDDLVNMINERDEISKNIMYVNDEVARLYQNSKRGTEEFPDLGPLTRYCIAFGRYLQNPLMEYIAMGRDVISIPVHKNQNLIGEEKLYRAFESAMVDIVNLCGIDINDAVTDAYKALALPFIAGLGPRKAQSVLKKINSVGGYLENRAELITKQIVSKNIFMNCASFLRITGSGKDADPLDSTRVHPEDYDLAKKMAGDALELDEEDVVMAEQEGGVVKQLMEDDPEKLNDLILEEYADQLAKVFNQLKRNTLEQIKDELQSPYEELRRDFKTLPDEEVFTMLTGETEESLHEEMVVPVSIRRIGDRYISAFLDCGVEGTIPQGEMSDNPQVVGSQLFHANQTVNAVILTLDRAAFTANLSTRQSKIDEAQRLARNHPEINPEEWDDFAEERDRNRVAAKREAESKSTRVIKHPLFRSFNAKQAEEYLAGMQRGDAVIRPSSLGPDHIAVTWKFAEGVYQHIDVLELDKANEFSVGRQLRVGRKYTYSDLDELIVSHIKSMARKVDEMTTHEKFQRGSRDDTEQWLTTYSEANPRRSAYAFCIDKEHPGYFDLCFKTSPRAPVKSWPVKVVPGAFMLKDNLYGDMNALSNGFKRLFTAALKDQGRRR